MSKERTIVVTVKDVFHAESMDDDGAIRLDIYGTTPGGKLLRIKVVGLSACLSGHIRSELQRIANRLANQWREAGA